MEIKQETDNLQGRFFVEEEGKRLAHMSFVMSGPEIMIIDHTEVSANLRGQGIGKRLVLAGVKYARQNRLRVMPLCPFAKAEFQKHPEYSDVLG